MGYENSSHGFKHYHFLYSNVHDATKNAMRPDSMVILSNSYVLWERLSELMERMPGGWDGKSLLGEDAVGAKILKFGEDWTYAVVLKQHHPIDHFHRCRQVCENK